MKIRKEEVMEYYRLGFKDNKLMDCGGLDVTVRAENAYEIKLPNGYYNVRIYDGDLNDEGDVNVYTRLNGERQFPIWAGDRVIRSMDYKTRIGTGILNIGFEGKHVCIQGIDISSVIKDKITEITTFVDAKIQDSQVSLSFENSSSYDTVHIYKKEKNSGKDYEIIKVQGDTFADSEVELCKSYEYFIKIVDDLGFEGEKSACVIVEVKDESAEKGEIYELKAETYDYTHTKLTWTGKNAYAYDVYRRTDISKFKYLGEVKQSRDGEYVFTDDTLVTDRVYTYSIQARSLGGLSKIEEIQSQVRAPLRKRQKEVLDRAAIAIRKREGMYLTFRLNAYEYENGEFNIYADGKCIHHIGKKDATNFFHGEGTMDTVYTVKYVENGVEEEMGYTAKNLAHNYMDIPIQKLENYTAPDGNTYEYTANDASVADVDGDGEYEIILKWDCNGKDNSHKGYSGIVYIDAYKLDGTLLWRIDLGKNIRCGAHYTQFMVYDFDGDGYAEMVVKTADGTVDNEGNVVGDKDADYRNQEGFIIDGPEYLSLIDGKTGRIVDTVPYDPPRGNVADWGDSWGNRVDRFLACVAYLDGVHPSVVMCRGYYDHGRPTHLTAYDVVGKKLVKRWKFTADKEQNIEYTNQGFHNLAVADIDGDGCDEIIYGACAIDHDGTGIYSTELGHGDAMHLGRFTKESKGFDYFGIHEDADSPLGIEAHKAGTGEITFGIHTGKDTARGLTAKIDPRFDGNQMWAYFGGGLYNYADGSKITEKIPECVNFAIWWDGDLLRELLDHDWFGYETNVGIPKIYKWNWKTQECEVILATDGVLSNNGTKGNPCIQASIIGDWREDVIFRGKDSRFLRLYTTDHYTPHRIYTLMHDYVYRLGVAWQNTGYNQPPQTAMYIGPDMDEVKASEHCYITVK